MSIVTTTLISDGTQLDASYELLSVDIRREVNRIPLASVLLVDGDAALRKFAISDTSVFEPGKMIEIRLRYEDEGPDTTVFKGPVVRHGIEATAQGSVLRVELKDAAFKLTQGRKSAVFRDQRDDELMRKLLGDATLKTGTLTATKPTHPEILQYACSDWDFIVSRADVNGLLVVAEDGTVSARKIDLSTAVSHTLDYGISHIHNFEFELDASQQFKGAQSTGWTRKLKGPPTSRRPRIFCSSRAIVTPPTWSRTWACQR